MTFIPTIGSVGAGKVVPMFPHKQTLELPAHITTTGRRIKSVAYLITGDSLIGSGVRDGDNLVCIDDFSLSDVKPYKVCVVEIISTGELLAKHVIFQKNAVILRSSNPKYADQTYGIDDIAVRHISVGVYRCM